MKAYISAFIMQSKGIYMASTFTRQIWQFAIGSSWHKWFTTIASIRSIYLTITTNNFNSINFTPIAPLNNIYCCSRIQFKTLKSSSISSMPISPSISISIRGRKKYYLGNFSSLDYIFPKKNVQIVNINQFICALNWLPNSDGIQSRAWSDFHSRDISI